MDDTSVAEYLSQEDYLVGDEWDLMVAGDRHTTVLYWIATQTQLMHASNTDIGYTRILDGVTEMRSAANDLMSAISTENPFAYTVLCGFLVKMNIFIFTTWKGLLLSLLFFDIFIYVNTVITRSLTHSPIY